MEVDRREKSICDLYTCTLLHDRGGGLDEVMSSKVAVGAINLIKLQ